MSKIRRERAVAGLLLAATLLLAAPTALHGLGCEFRFDAPDGTPPSEYYLYLTGDPYDSGGFAVQGSTFVHVEPSPGHYVVGCDADVVWLRFDAMGSGWELAWNICGTLTDGRCLRLSHDDRYGQWAFCLAEVDWSVPDSPEYAGASYMWYHGVDTSVALYPTGGPLTGWHRVEIEDVWLATMVIVWVDAVLIFEEPMGSGGEEYGPQGIGCSTHDIGTPAFDNVEFHWPDPVEQTSWGSIKAMYR